MSDLVDRLRLSASGAVTLHPSHYQKDSKDAADEIERLLSELNAMERRARAYEAGATKVQHELNAALEALRQVCLELSGNGQTHNSLVRALNIAHDALGDLDHEQ